MLQRFILPAAILLAFVCELRAQEWGTLTGQFIYDGTPPAPPVPKKFDIPGEKGEAIEFIDESLLVDAKGGLANVVIYVQPESGKELAVHPDYEETANAKVVLEIKNCRFQPHVFPMRTTQTLAIKSLDPFGHNPRIDGLANRPFGEIIPVKDSFEQLMPSPERVPAHVGCNIHPFENGYLVVRPDPYVAVSAPDGMFTIANIPTGAHELVIWHEESSYVKEATIGGVKTALRKKPKFYPYTVKAGPNDLGQIKVDPALLTR